MYVFGDFEFALLIIRVFLRPIEFLSMVIAYSRVRVWLTSPTDSSHPILSNTSANMRIRIWAYTCPSHFLPTNSSPNRMAALTVSSVLLCAESIIPQFSASWAVNLAARSMSSRWDLGAPILLRISATNQSGILSPMSSSDM